MHHEDRLRALSEIRDTFEQALADCLDQVLQKTELHQMIYQARERLKDILEPGSRAFRVFERMAQHAGPYWISDFGTSYVPPNECSQARSWLEIITAVLLELDPMAAAARNAKQLVLPAGDTYGAVRKILRVMKLANSSLTIIDPFLDSTVFDYLDEIQQNIKLQLLTGAPPKPMFLVLLASFRALPRVVEARAATSFHDRFLIIDDADAWHLGTSLNSVGKKTSMLNRVTEDVERQRLLNEFQAGWSGAGVL